MKARRYPRPVPRRQRGLGLVEAMIAVAIVVFVALATSNAHVVAVTGVHRAGFHFALDGLSNEMLEQLRARRSDARAGAFDHAAEDALNAVPAAAEWRARVADAIPGARTTIECDDGFCSLGIEWSEDIDGTVRLQYFNSGTPV